MNLLYFFACMASEPAPLVEVNNMELALNSQGDIPIPEESIRSTISEGLYKKLGILIDYIYTSAALEETETYLTLFEQLPRGVFSPFLSDQNEQKDFIEEKIKKNDNSVLIKEYSKIKNNNLKDCKIFGYLNNFHKILMKYIYKLDIKNSQESNIFTTAIKEYRSIKGKIIENLNKKKQNLENELVSIKKTVLNNTNENIILVEGLSGTTITSKKVTLEEAEKDVKENTGMRAAIKEIAETVRGEKESSKKMEFDKELIFDQTVKNQRAVIHYDENENVVIVACRGSMNFLDWQSNYDNDLLELTESGEKVTETNQGDEKTNFYVHRGLYNISENMLDDVIKKIKEIQENKKPTLRVLFTGHDQGAAVASILAGRFKYHIKQEKANDVEELSKIKNLVQLYVFSMPLTFERSGVQWLHNLLGQENIIRQSVIDDPLCVVDPKIVQSPMNIFSLAEYVLRDVHPFEKTFSGKAFDFVFDAVIPSVIGIGGAFVSDLVIKRAINKELQPPVKNVPAAGNEAGSKPESASYATSFPLIPIFSQDKYIFGGMGKVPPAVGGNSSAHFTKTVFESPENSLLGRLKQDFSAKIGEKLQKIVLSLSETDNPIFVEHLKDSAEKLMKKDFVGFGIDPLKNFKNPELLWIVHSYERALHPEFQDSIFSIIDKEKEDRLKKIKNYYQDGEDWGGIKKKFHEEFETSFAHIGYLALDTAIIPDLHKETEHLECFFKKSQYHDLAKEAVISAIDLAGPVHYYSTGSAWIKEGYTRGGAFNYSLATCENHIVYEKEDAVRTNQLKACPSKCIKDVTGSKEKICIPKKVSKLLQEGFRHSIKYQISQ